MSSSIWGTIVPSTTSGNQLAVYLNDFKSAVVSGFTGTSRPTQLEAGGYWIDTTLEGSQNIWEYKIWTGTTNITLLRINLATGAPSVSGSDSSFEISKISADSVGPILKLLKERIANAGQTLTSDTLGEIQFVSSADDASNPITAKIKVVASENTTNTNSGSYLVFEATDAGSSARLEKMRLVNGKLGIGVTSPDAYLHVKGDVVFKGERIEDTTSGARSILRKKKATGTGQTVNADTIGAYEFNSTDQTGSEMGVARIIAEATQTHTDTAQGTKVTIAVKKTGQSSYSDVAIFGDTVTMPTVSVTTATIDTANITTLNATTTNLGTVVETGDAQVVLNKDGNQAAANAGPAGFKVEMSDATHAALGYDSTKASKFVIGEVGTLKEVVDVSSIQALSNKDFDGGTASNTSRFTIPKNSTSNISGLTRKQGTLFYDTTQNKPFYDDGTNLKSIGGVSPWATGTAYSLNDVVTYSNKAWRCTQGHTAPSTFESNFESNWALLGGSENIMKVGDTFESTTASGWQVGTISGYTAGTFPTTAVSGLGDATVSGAGYLTGVYSLTFSATAAGTAQISPAITLDSTVSGKNLTFSFDYKLINGVGSTNVSGTSANTFHVLLYDVTNSKYIQPTNTYGITSALGTWKGTAQPDSNCNSIKFVLLIANTVGATPAPVFDNFCISKKIAPTGAAITDPVQYTPIFGAGYGTVTNQKIYWTQSGKFMRVFGTATAGTTTAGTGEISLPSGKFVDVNFYQASAKNLVGGIRPIINTGGAGSGGSTQRLGFDGTNLDKVWLTSSSAQDVAGGTFAKTGVNSAFSTSDTLNIDFTVPIAGWSSNVQLSSDAGNSSIYSRATGNYTGGTGVDSIIIVPTATINEGGCYNAATGEFTASSPGNYDISGVLSATNNSINIRAFKNGVLDSLVGFTASNTAILSGSIYLNAGQILTIRSSASLGAALGSCAFIVRKSTNSQTIAANDTVGMRYTTTAGQSIPNTTATTVVFGTKDYDYNGAYNAATGVFTAPCPGVYDVDAGVQYASSAQGGTMTVMIYKQGAEVSGNYTLTSATVAPYACAISDKIYLLTGQTLEIKTFHNKGSAATLDTAVGRNKLSIVKVG